MSERPFITSEQALVFIDDMLNNSQYAGKVSESTLDAFEDMRARHHALTDKQLLWVQSVAVYLDMIIQPTTNQWSSRTPAEQTRIRGRDVPTPAILLHRPLKPPGRT